MNKKKAPGNLRNLADRYREEGNFEEAIDLYIKLIEINPGDDSLTMSLAWAYKDSGKADKAIESFEGLVEKELKRKVFTGFAFDELVRIYREQENYEGLVDICERAAKAQPDDTALLKTLGDSSSRAGKIERAIEVFEKLTQMEPDSPMPFCDLGNAHIMAGNYDVAEDAYERAISIEPSETCSFYNRLGDGYHRAGQYERAEVILKKSLAQCPHQPLCHCNLGDVFIKMGRLDEAKESYDNASRIDGSSGGVYYNRMGKTLAKEGLHLMAVEAFEKAIVEDPLNPFYYLSLVESCAAEGLDEKARAFYKKA
ncbi:MAG: tetratricopeptide repeat protein, partial [Thermodesulfobacteriota bacterium]|nr:tetratricopeptide repeat protein [Thermodesulfobacteriota bacterium]